MSASSQNDIKRQSEDLSKQNSSLCLDEFGIIRDKESKSSESLAVGEPRLNLTDDDLSEQLLTADTSANQNEETESLTEFEEIERLIKAHTIQDSGDEFPELPIDLENQILSGRVSRESSERCRSNYDVDDEYSNKFELNSSVDENARSHSFAEDETSFSDAKIVNQQDSQPIFYPDTGYSTLNPEISKLHAANVNNIDKQHTMPSNALVEDSSEPMLSCNDADQASHDISMRNDEPHVQAKNIESGVHISESNGNGLSGEYVIPTHRDTFGDTAQQESLVATFGTTEDFEVLLQKQLDANLSEEEGELLANKVDAMKGSGDHPLQKLKTNVISSNNSARSGIGIGSRKVSRVKPRKPSRSPAGNRIKRSKTGERVARKPSFRDSSDDLSLRSDISSTDLRLRLKEEAKSRKLDEEFMRELKSNYDTLLMKYAEAENTIDHLRLGAKINLYASVPTPATAENGDQHSKFSPPQSPSPLKPESRQTRLSSGVSDTLVESSLQLPAAATKEFLKVALQLQAKDLQDKIGSFHTLLRETNLSPIEQQLVMEDIEAAMRNLEGDYVHAVDQHIEDQRRASVATDGAIRISQDFDPDRSMEADILSLGQLVRRLQDEIKRSAAASPSSSLSTETKTETNSPQSASDSNVEFQFDALLQRYKESSSPSDGLHTTAPSSCLSDSESPNIPRNQEIPDQYLEPSNHISEGRHPTELVPSNHISEGRHPTDLVRSSLPPKYSTDPVHPPSMKSSPDISPTPAHSQSSKLPRPVTSKASKPSAERKYANASTGADSGFVGSESSRQSGRGVALEPAKPHLKGVVALQAPTSHPSSTDSPNIHQPLAAVRTRVPSVTPSRQSNSSFIPGTGNPNKLTPRASDGLPEHPSYSFSEDSVDDVSTTTTVREMLRRRSSSESNPPTRELPASREHLSGASARSRGSASRSVVSSTRDSTLDLIHGEIAKLREEMRASQLQKYVQPVSTSTPRRPFVSNNSEEDKSPKGATLQTMRDDIKALQEELRKGRHEKRRDKPLSESCSVASVPDPNRGRSRSEVRNSDEGRRSRHSRSLGRRKSTRTESRDRRSRSHDRSQPSTKGFWAYVPPSYDGVQDIYTHMRTVPPPPIHTVPPPPIHAIPSPSVVYAFPSQLHTTPVIAPPSGIVIGPRYGNGRVYPRSREAKYHISPSKPTASIYISPKSTSRGKLRKANVYVALSDDDDDGKRPSYRHPSSMKRDVIVVRGSSLDDSLERAERSAEALRCHSRSIYRSTRDSVYGSRSLADTL